MRNGRLLAEDAPNNLMNLYKEDVSVCLLNTVNQSFHS